MGFLFAHNRKYEFLYIWNGLNKSNKQTEQIYFGEFYFMTHNLYSYSSEIILDTKQFFFFKSYCIFFSQLKINDRLNVLKLQRI